MSYVNMFNHATSLYFVCFNSISCFNETNKVISIGSFTQKYYFLYYKVFVHKYYLFHSSLIHDT